jgi:L-aspartate oxidase
MESIYKSDVVIVGSGISGLMTAVSLYPRKVTLVTKRKLGEMSSSAWAQGGIAAAVTKEDSPQKHFDDTLKASSGLSNKIAVKTITEDALEVVKFLEKIGVNFDKDKNGFCLSKEAAHSYRRVLKINGDQSGKFLVRHLIDYAKQQGHITFVEDISIDHIIQKDNQCHGIMGHIHKNEVVDNFVFFQSPNVILATGGLGSIYAHTTNPRDVYGEAIAMAAKVNAKLVDLEFVQFHPTALDVGLDPAPLLTEAIRGEGAFIVDENNDRFVFKDDPLGEMAPRDVVSRSIHKHKLKGHSTFLDCRHFKINFEQMFPTASQYLHQSSIIPSKDLIPIIPAAHYHMGGIQVDINGKTSVEGLWACGECSSTGAHGANRLASNSLLEAFVFSKRIADTINSEPPKKSHNLINIENYIPKEKTISKIRAKKYIWQLRSAMNKFVGVDRNKFTLDQAFIEFFRIERETSKLSAKLKDMLLVSKLITFAAIKREESRGTHFRSDYPFQNKKLLNRNILNQKDLSDYLNNKFKEAV